jgi:hypothetical protein
MVYLAQRKDWISDKKVHSTPHATRPSLSCDFLVCGVMVYLTQRNGWISDKKVNTR